MDREEANHTCYLISRIKQLEEMYISNDPNTFKEMEISTNKDHVLDNEELEEMVKIKESQLRKKNKKEVKMIILQIKLNIGA